MSNSIKKLDSLKAILKNSKGEKGADLFQHLTAIFNRILLYYPDQGLERFEEISQQIKREQQTKQKPDFDKIHNYKDLSIFVEEWLSKGNKIFEKPIAGPDEEVQEPGPTGYVPDLLAESKMFEWAGVSFGEEETYRLWKSIKNLAISSGASSLRFWGKIYGSKRDYYIVEGILDAGEAEVPPDQEPRGKGLNKFAYWVTSSVLGEWKLLPDLHSGHLQVARKIKHLFTGDLEASVITNPHFDGKEKNLLRAQIARITHGTAMVPKGMYRTVEDDEKEIELFTGDDSGDYKLPATHELKSLDKWVHLHQGILKAGRTVHYPPEPKEGEEPEEILKALEKRDPYEKRLLPLSQDAPIPGVKTAWTIKMYGDSAEYQGLNPKVPSESCYAVIAIRSLRWPGFVTVFQSGKWTSIYVGQGLKAGERSFYPVNPPTIMEDPVDKQEQPEPTPLTEPEVVQEPQDDQ